MECTVENRQLVPLSRAVSASIIDRYGNIGQLEQRHSHWAARELRNLYIQVLPKIKHKVILTVNANTHTATLPLDWYEETFIGGINDKWNKVPIKLNNSLVDSKNVIDVDCEERCDKCNQDKAICNDLVVTESTNLIVINATTYTETVIKKLYPNGDYYLETTTPFWSLENSEVEYTTKKEFIVNFDLKPCGCLDTTPANITTLQTHCPDIYCNYYSTCDTTCCSSDQGGYKIFEESGLIQFNPSFPFEKIYMEYNGFIQKVRGQYYFPQVAFETIVEGIKLRAIKDKNNVPRWRILDKKEDYRDAKSDMRRILGRISLSQIIQAVTMLPKFDFDYGYNWYGCFTAPVDTDSVTTSNTCDVINTTTIINRTAYVLNVKCDGNPGSPIEGLSYYQNNVLIGATDLVYIIVAKVIETINDGNFTFDPITGTIDRNPNVFVFGDTLIANFNKIT